MRTSWKAATPALTLAVAALGIGACGSGDETTTTATRPAVSRDTADHLAKLSNRVASDLEVGETCSAAIAADDLRAAVEDSDLPANLRTGVDEVATDLVNQVNCPPPPPPPEPEKKPKKEKDQEHGDEGPRGGENDHGGDGSGPPGHSKHGGFVPPGQAKIKGEAG